jgi:hypothetical protein
MQNTLIMAAAPPDPAKIVLEGVGHSSENTYVALCELSGVPASTLWHRDHGRMSIQQRAAQQQWQQNWLLVAKVRQLFLERLAATSNLGRL